MSELYSFCVVAAIVTVIWFVFVTAKENREMMKEYYDLQKKYGGCDDE